MLTSASFALGKNINWTAHSAEYHAYKSEQQSIARWRKTQHFLKAEDVPPHVKTKKKNKKRDDTFLRFRILWTEYWANQEYADLFMFEINNAI